jgi:HD-GYP domain-containing protein (c-di-GMP phosphodiesterase class II)
VHEALGAVRSVTRLRRECRLGSPRLVRRVRAVAQALLAPPAEVDVLGYVASVHDVGMTRLEGVLPEATPLLEADERHAVMQHPEVGVEVIRPLEYQGVVRDIILAHHEWWDGSGYPRGLKHDEIPLGARILAVVDAYESMVSGRSYRAPMSSDEALAELRRHSGRQFDPDVVETLSAVIEREKHPW